MGAIGTISHVALGQQIQSGQFVGMQHALIIPETQHFIHDLANLVHDNGCAHAERRKIQLEHSQDVSGDAQPRFDTPKANCELMRCTNATRVSTLPITRAP